MGRKIRRMLLAAAVLLAVVAIGAGVWLGDYYPAGAAAEAAMGSDEAVAVTLREDGSVVFAPREAERGLIFYPGGKVEHTAYAPLLLELAENDVLCVLVKMPLNLAVLDVNAAEGIPEQFPEVEDWYLAGHSLGGSMAASFAGKQPGTYEGLILLAAYSTADLTETGMKVCSLYGDRDGVLNREKYQQYRSNLPEDTLELVLEGGNHAGFGSYGPQEGDGASALEAGVQIRWTAEQILTLIREG